MDLSEPTLQHVKWVGCASLLDDSDHDNIMVMQFSVCTMTSRGYDQYISAWNKIAEFSVRMMTSCGDDQYISAWQVLQNFLYAWWHHGEMIGTFLPDTNYIIRFVSSTICVYTLKMLLSGTQRIPDTNVGYYNKATWIDVMCDNITEFGVALRRLSAPAQSIWDRVNILECILLLVLLCRNTFRCTKTTS